MKEIPLWGRDGAVVGWAKIDDKDYALVSQYRWFCDGHGYARANIRKIGGKRKGGWSTVAMHRLILATSEDEIIDHRDGDKLNNQRSNLRRVSQKENTHNSRKHSDGSSRYKGVSWDESKQRWRARIQDTQIGRFLTEEEAARAYDQEAIRRFGAFARTNFPLEEYYEATRTD